LYRELSRLFLIVTLIFLWALPAMAKVDFERLSGSDLGLGIGAKANALGGAFTAVADDGSALYWNPAGMTEFSDHQVFVSGSDIAGFDFFTRAASMIFRFGTDNPLAIGIGHHIRLHFTGDSGLGDWSGYPSQLLDLSMIDIDDSYSGKIDSKTTDTRLSVAFQIPWYERLSAGLTYVMVD